MTAIKMTGGPELLAFLNAFPNRIKNGAIKASLTAGAGVVRDEAKLQVADTTVTGLLRKSIKTGKPRVNQNGTISVRVRTVGKHSYLAPWVEYGVKPHLITVKDKDGSLKIGKNFVGEEVEHPGIQAKAFLRPALDIKAREVIDVIGERMRKYMADKVSFAAPVTIESDDDEY